jgi:hypothetical protein
MTETPELTEWLATRPPIVADAFRKYLPYVGGKIDLGDGIDRWFMGIAEGAECRNEDDLFAILTPVDPAVDYDAATVAERTHICLTHFEGRV